MTAEIRSTMSVSEAPLYVAFELSQDRWMLGLTSGLGVAPWVRTVRAGDWAGVEQVLGRARKRFGLPAGTPVVSCYEAGRDGFWIHRALVARQMANRVVDSSSIEVNRRRRRAKTDRIDARKLVLLLVRVCLGDRRAWQEVRVPTVAEEAARHVSRERATLVQEQTRLVNQMRGWLAAVGARLPKRRSMGWAAQVRDAAGERLPRELQARLERTSMRLTLVATQIAELETAQAAALTQAPADSPAPRLLALRGISVTSTSTLLDEGLVWRDFRNRRQLGGLLGFAPTPYDSGAVVREQGMRGAGNRRLQSAAIQLAWNWVRWQKASALTQWYQARFGTGKRARRIGIVALPRKLMIALWRRATTGELPAGAVLKTI